MENKTINNMSNSLIKNNKEADRLLFYYNDLKEDLKSKIKQIDYIVEELFDSKDNFDESLSYFLSDIELIIQDSEDYDIAYLTETLEYINSINCDIEIIKDYVKEYNELSNDKEDFVFDFTEEEKIIDFVFSLKRKYGDNKHYWSEIINSDNETNILKDLKDYFIK